jgi:hypothetical protein
MTPATSSADAEATTNAIVSFKAAAGRQRMTGPKQHAVCDDDEAFPAEALRPYRTPRT